MSIFNKILFKSKTIKGITHEKKGGVVSILHNLDYSKIFEFKLIISNNYETKIYYDSKEFIVINSSFESNDLNKEFEIFVKYRT